MSLYVAERFSADEQGVLRRYFTNLDEPVFALVNLPEVVKGALFARYSRTHKSLRRLFLDEFVGDLDMTGDLTVDATVGVTSAEKLYERVFVDYGDESVAQLGGVHLACEQASIVLTKILEWGRLMAYLEQSTRYIAYDGRLSNGRYRYYRDPYVLESTLGARYVGDIDRMFDTYAELLEPMQKHLAQAHPKPAGHSDFVHRNALRAKGFDALRGLLPAATISNLGMYGSGQSYEQMILRMRASALPEARAYADLILKELRKVIPSFLERVDRADSGMAQSAYLETNRVMMEEVAHALFENETETEAPRVRLIDFDPDGEDKAIAAMLYPYTRIGETALIQRVQNMRADEKRQIVRAYVGQRKDRRNRPGRALERVSYRFDVCTDYGAFRDLQRHRMLTVEWQDLSPIHGFTTPAVIEDSGLAMQYRDSMERSAALYDALIDTFPNQAPYALALAYRIRFSMQFNAREALHMLELRSGPQGHPEYRRIAQEMHRAIAEQAGHRLLADAMVFVDHEGYEPEPIDVTAPSIV